MIIELQNKGRHKCEKELAKKAFPPISPQCQLLRIQLTLQHRLILNSNGFVAYISSRLGGAWYRLRELCVRTINCPNLAHILETKLPR